MNEKQLYKEDEGRGMLRGRFHSLVEPGEVVPIYNLCTLDHYYNKVTKRGKISRSLEEMRNLQKLLYDAKLEEKGKLSKITKVKSDKGLNEASLHTVSEAIEKFRNEYLPTKNAATQVNYNHALDYWDEVFGRKKLSELDEDEIQVARDNLKSPERSDTTLNRYLAVFSSMLTVCIEEFKICRRYEMRDGKRTKVGNMVNPCHAIKHLKMPDSRVRFLLPEESKSLLAACPPELKDAVMLSLFSGARKKEIWNLRYDSINFEKKVMTFWHTKNEKPRSVPLTSATFDILERRFKSSDGNAWVFPRQSGAKRGKTRKFLDKPRGFQAQWEIARAKAGLKDFRYHDLRHTAASYMVMAGVTLTAVCEILGHSDIKMTFRYAHLAPSHLKIAMDLLGEEMLRITT